jgi:hypothetical protein
VREGGEQRGVSRRRDEVEKGEGSLLRTTHRKV